MYAFAAMKITLISRIVLFIALFIMQSGLGLASQCESGFRNSTMSLEWTPEVCRYVIEKTNLLPGPACNYTLHSQETISNILVTGTARSGTTMISVLLKSLGYPFSDDNHAPTKNGMMSWMLIVKGSPQHFHDSGRSYRFRNMIHLVRDPLQCIVSLRTEMMYWKKNGFLLQYAPEVKVKELDEQSETDLLLFGLRVWVNWHALVDRAEVGTLVQVEKFCKRHNLATLLHYMCENKAHSAAALDLLHDQCRAKYQTQMGYNTRVVAKGAPCPISWLPCYEKPTEALTWKKLQSIDADLAMRAFAMARKYHYTYGEEHDVPSAWLE